MEPQPGDPKPAHRAAWGAFRAWAQGSGAAILGVVAVGVVGAATVFAFLWANERPTDTPTGVVEGVFFEIATGSVTGTYYPLGNVVASVIAHPAGSVRCGDPARCGPPGLTPAVQAAEGSVSNIEAVHAGISASAFAQADVLSQAYNGEGPFETAYADLRAISGLYGESLHLVVMRGAGIETIEDLRGRRVSVERRGSGTHGIATRVLGAAGLSARNAEIVHEPTDRAAEMLLAGELDAFFYVAGPPVRVVQDLTNLNLVDLVPLEGPAINALVAREPFITAAIIPEGAYLDVPQTRTIGMTAIWIVREDAPFELVYAITRAFWNPANRAMLEAGPEQARILSPRAAIQGVPIPFHPGAEQFYLEQGLLTGD
jgi:TRAP transporter TAXI family solute receptor